VKESVMINRGRGREGREGREGRGEGRERRY
jgi:hypothetical protein